MRKQDIAKMLGVSNTTLSLYSHGKRRISRDLMLRVHDSTGLDIKYIMAAQPDELLKRVESILSIEEEK